MIFKQDDIVTTLVCRVLTDDETTVGVGSIGQVTVVGVDMEDGSTDGVEVLFEGLWYGHYKPSELAHAAGNPPRPIEMHERIRVVQENHPFHMATGKISDIRSVIPGINAKAVEVLTIQLDDGRITQAFRHEVVRVIHDQPIRQLVEELNKEDRPHMKKDQEFNPLAEAVALVNAGFYGGELPVEDVYIVWFCSTIQNWKALVSTNVKDNAYYEVTHNGGENETYVDQYVKVKQMKVNRATNKATYTPEYDEL